MGKKKSFLFYYDWCDIFEPLSNEKKGELTTGVIDYVRSEREPDFSDLALKIAFNVIRNAINRDADKYEQKCLKNTENARKRWEHNANLCDRIRENANYADKDNDKDEDNDKDNDKEKDKDKDTDTDINNNSLSSFSAKKACAYSDDFLEFWEEYPKKVGKGGAFNTWKRAKLNSRDKDDILSALKWQKNSKQWTDANRNFVFLHSFTAKTKFFVAVRASPCPFQ